MIKHKLKRLKIHFYKPLIFWITFNKYLSDTRITTFLIIYFIKFIREYTKIKLIKTTLYCKKIFMCINIWNYYILFCKHHLLINYRLLIFFLLYLFPCFFSYFPTIFLFYVLVIHLELVTALFSSFFHFYLSYQDSYQASIARCSLWFKRIWFRTIYNI